MTTSVVALERLKSSLPEGLTYCDTVAAGLFAFVHEQVGAADEGFGGVLGLEEGRTDRDGNGQLMLLPTETGMGNEGTEFVG